MNTLSVYGILNVFHDFYSFWRTCKKVSERFKVDVTRTATPQLMSKVLKLKHRYVKDYSHIIHENFCQSKICFSVWNKTLNYS
jgi:hypothetical protein